MSPASPDLSVIVPAYNEVARIASTLAGIQAYLEARGHSYEIIVSADGTDGTRERALAFAAGNPRITVIGSPERGGKGRGIRHGVARVSGKVVGFVDADDKTPIEELDKLLPWFERGFDVVIGSRGLPGSRVEVLQPFYRRLGAQCFGLAMHLLVGLRHIPDTQCGFKFFRGDAARDIFARQVVDGYMFDVEILHLAERSRYRIAQVGVRWRDDADSRLELVADNWRNMLDLLRIALRRGRGQEGAAGTDAPGDAATEASCSLCGDPRSSLFARRNGIRLVRCAGCGLVSVTPQPDPAVLHDRYNSGQSSRVEYYLASERADRRSLAEMLDAAETEIRGRGRLLDVGPNVGTSLALARERGWEPHGVELNAEAARYCRKRGLDVRAGTLDSAGYAPESFDTVLMADVIEHLPEPLGAMQTVSSLLRPGGLVVISTPNIATWAARLLQIKPLEHLYYFTPASMTTLLTKAGLEVVRIEPLDRYRNLTAMAHSTTFGGLFQRLAGLFRVGHRVLGNVVVRLPLRENLLAIARKPDGGARGH